MSIWWAIGAFILVLTPIILIHEFGHFVAARLSGIRVQEFGIGFPPRAVKLFKRGDTVFSLNWIPVGGFVRPFGEDDPTVPGGLAGASKRARLFTLSAGAAANFIFAIFILWIAFMLGEPQIRPLVTEVLADSPATGAGIQAEDYILQINGRDVESSDDVREEIFRHAGEEIPIVLLRNGEKITTVVRPRLPDEYGDNEGPTGIGIANVMTGENKRVGPIQSFRKSVTTVGDIIFLTVRAPLMIVRGQITAEQARPVSVVGISQLAGRAAEVTVAERDWFPILQITAFISVALGFTNLLPIPALDGGRIMFVLIEAVRGRRIEPEREGMVHLVGMLVLLGLMVLIIIQDLVNPII